MWLPYYVVRIAEMRPSLIILAAMVAIGILVWKKTPDIGRRGLPESLLARLS